MLVRLKKIDTVSYIYEIDSIIKVYESFLHDTKYIVVLDNDDKPIGVIYKSDVKKNVSNVKDFFTKRLIVVNQDKKPDEIERIIFDVAKEQIDVVVSVDDEGKFKGVWEKIVCEHADFYEKYIFVKQAGYSIANWITNYYGQDAVIGIHSWSEYTELLIKDLENSGIKIKFICQSGGNNRGVWGNKVEKSFADISRNEIDECDLIINTFMSLQKQVEYLYCLHKNCNCVVNLYDIVNELYSYERDAGYMLRVANIIASSGRKVYIFDYPRLSEQKGRSEREDILLKNNLNVRTLQDKISKEHDDVEQIVMPALNKARKKFIDKEIDYKTFVDLYPQMTEKSIANIRYAGNTCILYDMSSPYVNIKNGNRVTIAPQYMQDQSVRRKIHIFGKSWIFGYHCADEYTIPSFVQRISNENGLGYYVYNHGIPGLREDMIANLMYEMDNKLPKDEIFVLIHMFGDYGNMYNKRVAQESGYVNELSSNRPHEYGEIWIDSGHIGEDGSEMLARQVVSSICGEGKTVPGVFKNKFNTCAGRTIYRYNSEDQISLWADMPEFKEYERYISEHKQRIGAIVMNCNPFTLGHRYLIETASKQCDKLYIFVVEEDKSIFTFKDRLELVKKGVRDLKNVTVLESGKFIISALTFPGYFSKSITNNISVDTSDDLMLFAKHIAKILGINVRFAGEEPFDLITKQYNESMRQLLPKYDIEFVEIPRKEVGDKVISASRVRKLLQEDNLDEIRELVPETTFEYLKSNIDVLKEKINAQEK